MRTPNVNLLDNDNPIAPKKVRPPAKFFLSPMLIAAIFAVSFVFGRFSQSSTAVNALATFEHIPVLGHVGRLISSADRRLQGEDADRINVLLLGMGGENHEGPYLTDTIIVASIQPSQQKVALLSVPRDLIVPLDGYGWRKINAANALGEQKHPKRGAETTRDVLEGVLGIEIPYYVRVDFNGFAKIVDAVGGVDINVERSFTDTTYPTNNFGIQTVSFKAGAQTMDGKAALRFARSRHGTNGEGNDFARSRRQQLVLTALKEKLADGKTYGDPGAIFALLATLHNHVTTNFQFGDVVRLANLGAGFSRPNLLHKVLDSAPGSPLVESSYEGAYVLLPRANDWNEIRGIASGIFATAQPARETLAPQEEHAAVAVLNGTPQNGFAKETADALTKKGFTVTKFGNAATLDYATSAIYDVTGKKSASLLRLREALGAVRTVGGEAAKKISADFPGADFIIILGKDKLKPI